MRVEWAGAILGSPAGMLAHHAVTESHVAPLQREGFVFEIVEVPQDLRVELAWPGPGTAITMVSAPRDGADPGGAYFTEWAGEGAQCVRIPAEALETGKWQVMIHTQNAVAADFVFTVATLGGKGAILNGPHTPAESATTQERDALPCDG